VVWEVDSVVVPAVGAVWEEEALAVVQVQVAQVRAVQARAVQGEAALAQEVAVEVLERVVEADSGRVVEEVAAASDRGAAAVEAVKLGGGVNHET
jgi:hypothetical protein